LKAGIVPAFVFIFSMVMKSFFSGIILWLSIPFAVIAQQNNYRQEFNLAYNACNTIPRGMLEAVAWNNTHIRHIDFNNEIESCTGMPRYYGVMGLIADGKNYFNKTLSLVASLSGIPEQEIINSPEKNILAYAKAFQQLQVQHNIFSSKPEDYVIILDALSEIPNDNAAVNDFAFNSQLYGIYHFLNNYSNSIQYVFPDYDIDFHLLFGNNYEVLSSTAVRISEGIVESANGTGYRSGSRSADYGSAIWNAAASCNYSSRSGTSISAVTIHTVQGSYAGCISWFQNCNASVSAHYVIRSSDGQVTQMVSESNKAWHVGSENPYTIGIEHEGYINDPSWYTQAMYQSSADLVRDICNSGYGINPLRTHYAPSCSGGSSQCQLGGCIKIKGHQHFPNQSHTDPGPNWNWTLFYQLINNNPTIVTYTTTTGTFYDSGGATGNYSDDERKLYLIKPTGASAITLSFSSFNLENNWDYLYVYDGDNLNAPLIGRFTGTTVTSPIASSGNALLIQFRSDCATVASGWAATWNAVVPVTDTIAPVTGVNVSQNWITENFTATFADADDVNGSGIIKSFYSVNYFHNSEWNANALSGFRCEETANDFLSRWTAATGTWIDENGNLSQTDEALSNTNIYAALQQDLSNQYLYSWECKIEGTGTNRRAGFHYFCDDAALTNRGNSYFVWFREESDQLEIYKVTNDVFSLQKNISYVFDANVWYDFKVIYDRTTGKHEIYVNSKFAMDWTDASPYTSGDYISFRSGNSKYTVKNLIVYRSRTNAVTVSMGSGNTDIPFESDNSFLPAGRICSVTKDAAKNISASVCENVKVDFSAPVSVMVTDSLVSDIDTTYVTDSLGSSWTSSEDTHSGIAAYWYAVGTTPGSNDFQDWTAATDTFFMLNNIQLTVGNTYYVSVKTENGAGLLSAVSSSDGVYIDSVPDIISSVIFSDKFYPVLFPNPAKDFFTVDLDDENINPVEIIIFDLSGKLLKQQLLSQSKTVSTEKLSKGIYAVAIKSGDRQWMKKLVVLK
jgi:hypothetical protein